MFPNDSKYVPQPFNHRGGGQPVSRGWSRAQPHQQYSRNFNFQSQQFEPEHGEKGGGKGRTNGWRGHNRGRYNGGRGNMTAVNNFHQNQKTNVSKANFYCCSCERGFATQGEYDEHNKEHIVCGLEGCQFEAHSLVVTKHIRMQHEGNLYQRMKNLNTPEDIQRWREERKKNFPTTVKVQEKIEEKKVKLERRELLNVQGKGKNGAKGSKLFCYRIRPNDSRNVAFAAAMKRLNNAQRSQGDEWMKRTFAPDLKFKNIRVPFFSMNKSDVVTLENFHLSVSCSKDGKIRKEKKVKWKGFKVKTLELAPDSDAEDDDVPISDDEEEFFGKMQVDEAEVAPREKLEAQIDSRVDKSQSTSQSIPLGLSLVDYSSASESEKEDDLEHGTKSKETKRNEKATQKEIQQSLEVSTSDKRGSEVDNSGDIVDGSKLTSIDPADEAAESDNDSGTEHGFKILEFDTDATFIDKPIFSLVNGQKCRRRIRRPRLLESLLQDQIRQERSALLQVCRYITENNFFDA